jgi:hypothetical protein
LPSPSPYLADSDRLRVQVRICKVMIAYAFLQHRRLAAARRKKKNQRATASADFTRRAPRHSRTHRSTATAMSALSKMDLQQAAA